MVSILVLLFGLVIFLFLLALIYFVYLYNKLVKLRERIRNAWSQIDVQLKRRYDLIPNLVETVKGYAKHEKEIFESVAKHREGLVRGSPSERAQANDIIGNALGRLFALAENYPDLKANQNFLDLQEQLKGTEDKIAIVRTAYNDTVYIYNSFIKTFPAVIFAGFLGFSEEPYFKVEGKERENIKVKF